MKRRNGAFRALIEQGARSAAIECLNADRSGRPTYKLHGKDMNASRAVWWLAHGDPGALNVLHACGNDQCLNVSHFYLGTLRQNQRDTLLMNRSTNLVLTIEQSREVAGLYRPGKAGHGNGNASELAARYGVSVAVIRLAAKRIARLAEQEIAS